MVVPSLNRPRQATPDPLSVLALLEDEQKFKLGGSADQVGWPPDPLTGSADHWSGRPTSQVSLCHIIDPHREKNTSALKSNRKTKHPMYPKAENAPIHGSTTSTIRGKSKVANAGLTHSRPTSYKIG
ncbi:hypothetical protein U9M48_013717 [Paspalum notatum var. saurae]|uniref:Uncharacterized protein n=1 Tax=Paspalum notatum var. saurae TaxID=547442 RepID=A0AAQ3T012_PASNO